MNNLKETLEKAIKFIEGFGGLGEVERKNKEDVLTLLRNQLSMSIHVSGEAICQCSNTEILVWDMEWCSDCGMCQPKGVHR